MKEKIVRETEKTCRNCLNVGSAVCVGCVEQTKGARDFSNWKPRQTNLAAFKKPSPTLFCSQWKRTVTLDYCREQCTAGDCLDLDQISKLAKLERGFKL